RLEDRRARGEPAPREECREQPRLGGLAGVKRLCHRAERRLEARRLRPGQAEGVEPLLLVEAEEMRTGGRGAEGPEGGRRVEARGVVPGPGERAAEEVEQAVPGHLERVGGDLLVADATYGAYERQRRAGAHRPRLGRIVPRREVSGISQRASSRGAPSDQPMSSCYVRRRD